jgi:hypothetical protein
MLATSLKRVYVRGIVANRSVVVCLGFVVPKGVIHRTRSPQRSVILMVENAGIIPTGN